MHILPLPFHVYCAVAVYMRRQHMTAMIQNGVLHACVWLVRQMSLRKLRLTVSQEQVSPFIRHTEHAKRLNAICQGNVRIIISEA